MDCVFPEIKNCQQGQSCPDGYECCSENVPGGKAPKFGLCVRSDQCDKKRGLPKRGCKDKSYKNDDRIERYAVYSKEGYGGNCGDWPKAFWVMVVVLCITFFLATSWHYRTVKHN